MMRKNLASWSKLSQPKSSLGRRGSVSLMMAGATIPLVISVGVGVDIARLAMAQVALQAAVDGAALAGANVYNGPTYNGNATKLATDYFAKYNQGSTVVVQTPTATAAPGSMPGAPTSYNVTVAAKGTLPTTFMKIAGYKTMTVSAHAVAGHPYSQPTPPTFTAGSAALGKPQSSAWDWNSAYVYPVPMDASGVHWDKLPSNKNAFYEVANNCRLQVASTWTSASDCNGRFGADWTGPTGPVPTFLPNQPIGFILINEQGGLQPYKDANGKLYPNAYGATDKNFAVFGTAPLASGASPNFYADGPQALAIINAIFPTAKAVSQPKNSSANYRQLSPGNCSLLIQPYDTTQPLPSEPPNSLKGKCYGVDDPASGSQYSGMSCAQMNGRTFIYWWNDMGGFTDDKDYNDLSYPFSCTPSTSGNQAGGSPPGGTSVALIQ